VRRRVEPPLVTMRRWLDKDRALTTLLVRDLISESLVILSSSPLLQKTPSDTDVLRNDELYSHSNPPTATSPLGHPVRRKQLLCDEQVLDPVAARGSEGKCEQQRSASCRWSRRNGLCSFP